MPEEPRRTKPLLPPPLWAALFLGGMIVTSRLFPLTRIDFPGLALVSLSLMLAGLGAAVAGVLAFRRHRTTVDPREPGKASSLVTSGIYGVTRNPMYLGMALIVTGFGLGTNSLIALSLAPVFVLALTKFQIEPEEAAMRRLFGEAYDAYAARVPRWLFV